MELSPRQGDASDGPKNGGGGDELLATEHVVLLVVDDDPALRESLAEVLRDERYVVATAADGQQALALMQNGLKPSLVLLDLWMPTLDGVTTLRMMRSTPGLSDIPVVVMTASLEEPEESVRTDAQAVLRKPLSLNGVVAAIDLYRRRPTKRREGT